MIRALYTSQTGMQAQQLQLDVTANNLANVNTSAFKKSRAQFEDLIYQNMRAAGAETVGGNQVPTGIQVGLGTRTTAVQKIFTQGDYTQSGNDLDLAIEGKGFFQVVRDGVEYYTRAGAFTKDSDGYIVNQNGDRLQPEFAIPEDTVILEIDSAGMLSAMDTEQQTLGSMQLTLHTFINPGGLKATGGNNYLPTDASGDPIESNPGSDAAGTLAQGYLEMSNVSVTEEMVNLIITQRAFDANSKGISTADQILEVTNNLVR
ncbi:MAG: flagellar basal-body rod protein FlgG [Deltaproteobacteria bacterium]|jgi:flagellar basal-body rod protein FlgG|nr:flagellar basal-body rod protein FlgG [Deltaproteobacteria bacterium]